jgi:hypothetical protein
MVGVGEGWRVRASEAASNWKKSRAQHSSLRCTALHCTALPCQALLHAAEPTTRIRIAAHAPSPESVAVYNLTSEPFARRFVIDSCTASSLGCDLGKPSLSLPGAVWRLRRPTQRLTLGEI